MLCAAHPNIVQLREVFLTGQHLAIVMEYANGGDLAHYVDALMQHTVCHPAPPAVPEGGGRRLGPTSMLTALCRLLNAVERIGASAAKWSQSNRTGRLATDLSGCGCGLLRLTA